MTSAVRVLASLGHREPDRSPQDFGGTFVRSMHLRCIATRRDGYGLAKTTVKMIAAVHEFAGMPV